MSDSVQNDGSLKVQFTQQKKLCWKCTHPQAIQNIDEFISSSEQIWRDVTLHHLLTSGCSAVNVMLHFSKSVQMNELIHILDGLKVSKSSTNVHFGVNFSFKCAELTVLISRI